MMNWDKYHQQYIEAQSLTNRQQANLRLKRLFADINANFPRDHSPDLGWLADAFGDSQKKWFAAEVLARKSPLPPRLIGPLLLAGVLEPNPSINRKFIEPCVKDLGAIEVRRRLLGYLKNGSEAEKAGAARALYWAADQGPADSELEQEIRIVQLTTFIENDNVNVRQCLIPTMTFDAKKYPPKFKQLIKDAIAIARTSDDEYIRHRVEIQLGKRGSLLPLPLQASE